jgi:hypothetical protein
MCLTNCRHISLTTFPLHFTKKKKSSQNVKCCCFGFWLSSCNYIFTLETYIQATVYIFIRRVAYINPFNDYLISRYFDSVIISSLSILWLVLSLDRKLTRIIVSTIYSILLVIAIAARLQGLIALIEMSTLPMIVFFLYYQKSTRQPHK